MADSNLALDQLLEPFWLSTTMHRESVMFIGPADEPAEATLLFHPDELLRVESAATNASYTEGDDYRIDRQAGRIVRAPGSRMPLVAPQTIAAADGALTHDQTVVVSYRHRDVWRGFVPASAVEQLPRIAAKLERREPLTICLAGDSISEGYDASGFHDLPPYQPAFGPLVASGLRRRCGCDIQFHNFGTAGWTTVDALWDTERITSVSPDLVIVAFGMNDASYAEAGEYATNLSGILSNVRTVIPRAEFIIVSPMLPAPECEWLVHSRFAEYRDALTTLIADGVALADVTTFWTELLLRKNPHDLSGNGWNHPNDFGHRIYAQTILAVLGRE
jgi:acyl-CoA thioesterase I